MTSDPIEKAVELGGRVAQVWIATAGSNGRPHLVTAHRLGRNPGNGFVEVFSWFCPGTLSNLNQNGRITLVVWDPATDQGYQLYGTVEAVDETAVLNGYAQTPEPASSVQIERKLLIRVEEISAFCRGPHSDALLS